MGVDAGGLSDSPIPSIPLQNWAHMRQGMTLNSIPLNDEPRLAVWILAVGEFLVLVGSKGCQVVAQAFGYFKGFSFGSWGCGHGRKINMKSDSITCGGFNAQISLLVFGVGISPSDKLSPMPDKRSFESGSPSGVRCWPMITDISDTVGA